MRLLHFEAGRLVLTNFTGKPIPPYAILSHRWTDSEVLFEHVIRGKSREEVEKGQEEGRSWYKVNFCAQKAAQHNLKYFWIDSCCIDKWNHAERDRSVNSMFKWYQNAARCFVFLYDVNTTGIVPGSQNDSWKLQLRNSEWFQRGWTLQELIAPTFVDFYDSQGSWLGDKVSLQQLIHEVTGVPKQALADGRVNDFSHDERLQWSANRSTTEPEDNAYCLLGILGVEMSLSYSEGKDRAMRRLKQELKAADRAPSVLPFSRNDRYTGHEDTLADAQHKLFSKDKLDILIITGKSGSGKSSLALEFCHRTRQQRQQCSVFWVDASTTDTLQQSYSNIARKLQVLQDTDSMEKTITAAHQYLQSEASGEWLLVYDNANDFLLLSTILSSAPQQNINIDLSTSTNGSIIVTTTDLEVASNLPASFIAMPELSEESAFDVLQAYFYDSTTADKEQTEIRELGRLLTRPLAIVVAAASLRRSKVPIQRYIEMVHREVEARITQESSEDRSTEIVIGLSLHQIAEDNRQAADCLFLLGCFSRQDIPMALIEDDITDEVKYSIEVLVQYGLVTRRPASSAIDIHQMVHSTIIRHLEGVGRFEYYNQQALQRMTEVFPDPDVQNRSRWRRYLPHARQVIGKANNKNDSNCLDLMSYCGTAFYLDGRWKEAEELEVRVMETRKTVLGQDHPDTLTSMANLAATYRNQGRWKEAEELRVRVMEIRKTVLGQDHPNTLTSMGNLASTYRNQGRWKEAEELEVRVMETMKTVLGQDHPDTLTSMDNLALTYRNQGRWKEAEELFVRVMETSVTVLGQDHPDTLTSIDNLALTYLNQGRWKEAEELFVRVMETSVTVLGQDHPDTLTSMGNLASTYRNQGRWKEAEELEVRVMETRKTVLGHDHPDTLTSMGNLAATYLNQGRWKEAEELFVRVMETSVTVLGQDHPDTLTSMGNLAATYRNQGRWKEAEELEVQVMETSVTVLGQDHPDTLISMANLAATYRNQGRWKEAEELEVRVMETSVTVLGQDHPDTLTSMTNLAATYSKQGRWKEAEELREQVTEIREMTSVGR